MTRFWGTGLKTLGVAAHNLLILTLGWWDHASSRTRAVQYIPLLDQSGRFKALWMPRVPDQSKPKLAFAVQKRLFTIRRYSLLVFRRWDVVFVQKLHLPRWVLTWLRFRRIPIVYDFDDAIYLPESGFTNARTRTMRMIKAAETVIVGSPVHVRICETVGTPVRMVPTAVQLDRFKILDNYHQDDLLTIGWIGSHRVPCSEC